MISERVAVKFADEIVADNAAIQKYVYDRYGVNANLIEYGADHTHTQKISLDTLIKFPFLANEYAFKVARIEPENNIKMILEAFEMQEHLPLVFVGNWDASDYGKSLRKEFAHVSNLFLLDPIYDSVLLNEMRSNCKVYIHGHSAGGTNPSLVEAMYLGLPIFSFDIVYNKITTENKAFFFSDAKELSEMVQFEDRLNLINMAKELTEVAFRRYRWSVIAEKYSALTLGTAEKSKPVFDFELPLALRKAI